MDKKKTGSNPPGKPAATVHFPNDRAACGSKSRRAAQQNLAQREKKILFGAVLKQARLKAGIQQKDFAGMLGVSRNTVVNWEADKYKPDHELIPEICSILDLTVSDLFGIRDDRTVTRPEFNIILDYRELSPVGQKFAENMIANLLDTERRAKDDEYRGGYRIFEKPATKAAAGAGYDFVGLPPKPVFIRRNFTNERADSVVEVVGDSMLPIYHDGDLVYVRRTQAVCPDEDVVCRSVDGMVIKRMTGDRKLRSLNKAIPYGEKSEDDNVQVVGRVLGIVDPADCADPDELGLLEELFAAELREFRREHGIED